MKAPETMLLWNPMECFPKPEMITYADADNAMSLQIPIWPKLSPTYRMSSMCEESRKLRDTIGKHIGERGLDTNLQQYRLTIPSF